MTERNQKVMDTLTVLGISGLDDLERDGLFYKEWYDLGNSIKYLNKIEHKFNIDLRNVMLDCIKYELTSKNSLFWQTVYKLSDRETYANLGLNYLEESRRKLCQSFKNFNGVELGNIIKNIYGTITNTRLDLVSALFLDERECIKYMYIHKDKVYVVKEDAEFIWDKTFLVKKVKTKGTYNISEVKYDVVRGIMDGKPLLPIMMHDEAKLLVKNENYGYITGHNYQHNQVVRFDKFDYLLKDCELILF